MYIIFNTVIMMLKINCLIIVTKRNGRNMCIYQVDYCMRYVFHELRSFNFILIIVQTVIIHNLGNPDPQVSEVNV